MSKRDIAILTDVALITCVVQRGVAEKIITVAYEAGAQGAWRGGGEGEGVEATAERLARL